MRNTPKMGLYDWNSLPDPYNYQQLDLNWNIIDSHDHSPSRGVQIGMAGIAAGAVGPTQLADNVPVLTTGMILMWPQTTAPAGFLICNGTQYVSTQYPALFALLGTTWGPTGTPPSPPVFNVPNINLANTHLNIAGALIAIIKT